MAVVKANAYGHGAVECARALEPEGVDWFGVALASGGSELRRSGIRNPILCFGGFWPGEEAASIRDGLTPVVFDQDGIDRISSAAEELGVTARVHVKIDTGMGRVGVRPGDVGEFAELLLKRSHLDVEGVMTHFAAADEPAEDKFTREQIDSFSQAVEILRGKGLAPKYVDMANSPGAVVHPLSRGNMVRLGGVLYGLGGDILPLGVPKPELKPVLSLHSRVGQLKTVPTGETIGYGRAFTTQRESRIATIPIGYHDGFRRRLSNIGRIIVGGSFAPVVGRISMDWITVDVTDVSEVRVGSPVVIIGSSGDKTIRAEDIAASIDTISYEITCGIGHRVPRVYR
jgi:alanine racemase